MAARMVWSGLRSRVSVRPSRWCLTAWMQVSYFQGGVRSTRWSVELASGFASGLGVGLEVLAAVVDGRQVVGGDVPSAGAGGCLGHAVSLHGVLSAGFGVFLEEFPESFGEGPGLIGEQLHLVDLPPAVAHVPEGDAAAVVGVVEEAVAGWVGGDVQHRVLLEGGAGS